MKFRHFLWLLLAFFFEQVAAVDLTNSIFEEVGNKKGIDPYLLYSVALAESAYSPTNNGWVAPYRYTLRTFDRPYYTNSKEEAEKLLTELLKTHKSIDVGLMQINVKWHAHRIYKPTDLLDARVNLSVGADILKERLSANKNNLFEALGQYHSFDPNRGYRYASLVINIYNQLQNVTPKQPSLLIW